MRTDRVFTNRTCNQNCTFCTDRRASDDRTFLSPAAVRDRIAASVAKGAKELVLTGGEPTLRRDLTELASFASGLGASVVLETNATTIDRARARALREAGVVLFRVHVPAWGPQTNAITRDDEGFASLERGLNALLAESCAVEVAIPIVRHNLSLVAAIPAALPAGVRAILVRVPHESTSPDELVSWEESVPAIIALERSARSRSIPVKLSPDSGPTPCVFPARSRLPHLYSMSGRAEQRADRMHPPACAECRAREHCSGIPREYVARRGLPSMSPITDDRTRRRLTLISSVDEQIAREIVTPNRAHTDTGTLDEEVIRVNFHCNQSCSFCFVSTHLPMPDDALVRGSIESALARGVKIVLSGGEPTLNPRLPEYLRLAATGKHAVELQTNAVNLDDAQLAKTLVESGMREAFVSLHGTTAATSDAITAAPGTFARTLVGLDNVYRLGVLTRVNFVICRSNARELPELVDLVAERWPRAFLNVSFVAPSTDVVPRDEELIPRYSEIMPHVARAVARARELGVTIGGFESMCGIPLCLVPVSSDPFFVMDEVPDGFDRGEFLKADACLKCALGTKCYGVRRGYAELHGTGELHPITDARAP